jgi:hypothetical protein
MKKFAINAQINFSKDLPFLENNPQKGSFSKFSCDLTAVSTSLLYIHKTEVT